MIPMSAQEIAAAVDGVLHGDGTACAVCTDSRNLIKDSLFIPLVGERFDGHAYLTAALEHGAAGCLTQRPPETLPDGKFYIEVTDTRLAMKALAAHYRSKFRIPFIQVTGSVGKTTTKEMVAAVLSRRFKVHKTAGNLNNDIGVPLTLFGLTEEHEVAVIESGMNHFGEIQYISEMVRPDIGVISNIGDAHIEFLGSREGILQAKCEMLPYIKEGGLAVFCGDDALLNTVEPQQFQILRCGTGEHCNISLDHVVDNGVKGISCSVKTEKTTYPIKIPALGKHMIYPASMAIAIGEALGMTRDELIAGVSDYLPAGSRMRVISVSEDRTILDDCYNASPQSMEAALEILSKERHTLAILGDMGELGDYTKEAHKKVGSFAASHSIDCLIAIGPKSIDLYEAANETMDAMWFETVEAAFPAIKERFVPHTVALVKASHAMAFEQITEYLKTL